MARTLRVPLLAVTVTRLLIENNRSEHHRALFSAISKPLPPEEKQRILEQYWQPHRRRVGTAIKTFLSHRHRVIHLGVHSFTPILDETPRNFDIGLLYDPARRFETAVARKWRDALHACTPHLRVRMNTPYRGTADGLTTALRRSYPAARYAGIELEMNQGLIRTGGRFSSDLTAALCTTLQQVLTPECHASRGRTRR